MGCAAATTLAVGICVRDQGPRVPVDEVDQLVTRNQARELADWRGGG